MTTLDGAVAAVRADQQDSPSSAPVTQQMQFPEPLYDRMVRAQAYKALHPSLWDRTVQNLPGILGGVVLMVVVVRIIIRLTTLPPKR